MGIGAAARKIVHWAEGEYHIYGLLVACSFISPSAQQINVNLVIAKPTQCTSIIRNVVVKTSSELPEVRKVVDTSRYLRSVDYSRIVCILWGAVKDLQLQVAALATSIAALEARFQMIRNTYMSLCIRMSYVPR